MRPLVSILIPAFNAEKWIAETLRSALAQTWDAKEVVFVDDGSTDRTLAIARQFESYGVRIVTQANQGAAAARNEAFRLSRGDYIQWLDADDLLAPDKIALQMEERRSERVLLSSAWASFLHRHNRAQFNPSALWSDLTPREWLVRKMGQNLHMQTATWLVSRELTEAAGPWDTTLLGDDDGEYFCRVLLASYGVHFVPDSKVYYRTSGTSSLSYIGQSERKIRAHWRSMRLHMDYLRSLEDSERTRMACVTYMQNWFSCFYPEHNGIINEAEQLAADLGGKLYPPSLSWKYSWIKALFGWELAKRAQSKTRSARWSFQSRWDRLLFTIQNHGAARA
ncbi:MAG: glycosyltransferase family 2 protein [Bryobacteraceae bacterium]